MIRTIKELKEAIKNLPDDMLVQGYDGSDRECFITYWLMTEDTLTEEEINDGFDGVAPSIFVISTD